MSRNQGFSDLRASQRPRSSAGRRPNSPPFVLFVLILLGAGGLAAFGLYTFTAVAVTLTVDGQTFPIRTHQSTVGGVLADANLSLEAADRLTPPRDTPIQSGLVITIDRAHPVVIDINGQPRRILTHATDPNEVLVEAAITPGAHDNISTQYPSEISLIHAMKVTIVDGDQAKTVYTTSQTGSAILAENGITLYVADHVSPDLNAPIQDGATITIQRSIPITIEVDGRTIATRTHGATVGDALNEAGIALVGLDQSVPPADQPITPGVTIHVTRITETEEVEQIPLPFKTITQVDPSLAPGTQHVIQQGMAGLAEIHIRVRRVDGLEISRSAPLSWIVQPPQDQIMAISGGSAVTPTIIPSPTANS